MTLNSNINTGKVPVLLAPMAGVTDLPFRNVVSKFGVDMVFSEMIADNSLLSRPVKNQKIELGTSFSNTAVQLAGCEPATMGEAAKIVSDLGAGAIDINMGCPAKKVVGGYSGSALMRDLKKASAIVERVVNAVNVPVSLKARLGWDDGSKNAKDLALLAEQCGVQLITIHARTRNQFYKGFADWNAILEVKKAVKIPVIANGDIVDISSASQALKVSETDGLMMGRGVIGKPWVISQISAFVNGEPQPSSPAGLGLIEVIAGHYDETLSFYGEFLGVRIARKHLKRYLDIFGLSKQLTTEFLRENSAKEVIRKLFEIPERVNP
ncbi:MAG: tRNA dihydrouridine synthase DusB [Paracoccaceae bacterium]|uniref:tRNA dihydrouridine synthase DusB n=1 Tax=Candidatus Salinivivens marinus TaxID=3381703 RepID=UPI000BE06EA5|nr:MAG: tRNA dihydrouridine synthase DusB [Rhodobacteraceae bacterium MED-G08]|tara:strand:- start:5542 stop:6513 length:972 start_codon:yes stop_codon:yes gene_type:complete